MRQTLTFFIFFFFCNIVSGQLSETWRRFDSIAFQYQYGGNDMFDVITKDGLGGIYVAGSIDGDIEVFHYNYSTQLQWKQRLNSNGLEFDAASGMEVASTGLIYVAGTVQDFSSNANVLLACLDSSGTILWERTWNGSWNGKDKGQSMKILPSGNIAVVGSTQTGITDYDCLLLVWSATGVLISTQELPSPISITNNSNSFYNVAVLTNNNIVACGQMKDTITGKDGILTCFDAQGSSILWNRLWSDSTSLSGEEYFESIITDTGGIFVGGSARSSVRACVVHYSNSGIFQWSFKTPLIEDCSSVVDIAFDPNGNICGAVRGSMDNIRTIKFGRLGNVIWSYTYIPSPYNGFDSPYEIQIDANGNIYVSGFVSDCVSCKNQAVLKLKPNGTFSWIRLRSGNEATSEDYSWALLVSGNLVISAGMESNLNTGQDATISVYDTSGTSVQMVTYSQPGGALLNIKMTTDSSGNIYTCGNLGNLFMTTKRDFQGNLIWKAEFQDTVSSIMVCGIKVDNQGNVFVGGSEYHTLSHQDFLLMKYNASGQLQWISTYTSAGPLSDFIRSICLDNFGNIYLAGETSLGAGVGDVVVIKYNSSGSLIWSQLFTGSSPSEDQAGQIISDGPNSLYFTFSPRNYTSGSDIALVHLDTAGNVLWQSTWNDSVNYNDYGYYVGKFADNKLVVVGSSSCPAYGGDIELLEYDTSGNLIWKRALRSANIYGIDGVSGIALKGDTLYLCGGESLPPSASQLSFYCGAVNSSGIILWERLLNSAYGADANANAIAVDQSSGIVAATGYTNSDKDIKTVLFSPSGNIIDSAITGTTNNDNGRFIASHDNSFIVGGEVGYDNLYGGGIIGITIRYCNGPSIQASSDILICPGDSAQLFATAGFASYQWSPSTNLNNSTINNPVSWPTSTTTYSVTATNNSGCESYADQEVIVGSMPLMSISSGAPIICSGDTLPISISGVTSCLW